MRFPMGEQIGGSVKHEDKLSADSEQKSASNDYESHHQLRSVGGIVGGVGCLEP